MYRQTHTHTCALGTGFKLARKKCPTHWKVLGSWNLISKCQADNYGTLVTLANLTLIILSLERLKNVEIISSKSKNIVKENSEYLRTFHLLK